MKWYWLTLLLLGLLFDSGKGQLANPPKPVTTRPRLVVQLGHSAMVLAAAWSQDGRWLIFASNRGEAPNVGQIYSIRLDGTGLTRLTQGLSKAQPSLSADGKRLYFYENLETDQFEIGHIASIEISLGN